MSTEFSIRTARPGDRAPVSALLAASYSALMPSGYDEASLAGALPLMTRANPKLLSSGTYFVAETAGGRLVGCGGWSRERPGTTDVEPDLGHVRHFGTDPTWLRRAVGRALFERCEQTARAVGVRRFECYSSLNAERFYKALGFETVSRVDISMGAGLMLPSILMARPI